MSWAFQRKNKYSAKKTEIDGIVFASKGESFCYLYLRQLERSGTIKILDLQDKVYLTHAKILYKPDFKIMDLTIDKIVWIEFKGKETASWAIKKRLWKYYGPGPLRIYKAMGSGVVLTEEVNP